MKHNLGKKKKKKHIRTIILSDPDIVYNKYVKSYYIMAWEYKDMIAIIE